MAAELHLANTPSRCIFFFSTLRALVDIVVTDENLARGVPLRLSDYRKTPVGRLNQAPDGVLGHDKMPSLG